MFKKICEAEYFASPEVSNSDLGKLRISPYAYKWFKENGSSFKSQAMAMGSLVHAMYLEPDTLNDNFALKPVADRRTKMGKQLYEEFEKGNKGKVVVGQEDWAKAERLVGQLNSRLGTIEKLAGAGDAELSGFWHLEGQKCRGRFDYLAKDNVIWDVKTTSSLIDFAKSVANFGYHRQAAFYGAGLREITGAFKGFNFIVVETQEPYDCAVLTLKPDNIRRGFKEVKELLQLLTECEKNNHWPGAFDFKAEIELPRWY